MKIAIETEVSTSAKQHAMIKGKKLINNEGNNDFSRLPNFELDLFQYPNNFQTALLLISFS